MQCDKRIGESDRCNSKTTTTKWWEKKLPEREMQWAKIEIFEWKWMRDGVTWMHNIFAVLWWQAQWMRIRLEE